MKRFFQVLAVSCAALFVLGSAGEVDQAVDRLKSKVATSWGERSAAAMAGLWADDGEIVSMKGEKAKGKVQVKAFLEKHVGDAKKDSALTIDVKKIKRPKAGVVLVEADYAFTKIQRGEAVETLTGTYEIKLVKDDGPWRVKHARPQAP